MLTDMQDAFNNINNINNNNKNNTRPIDRWHSN